MMRRLFYTYTSFFIFSLLLLACQSRNEQAKAAPRPRFHEEPRTFGVVNLSYSDSSSPEWRRTAARLDSFYAVQMRVGFNGSVLVGYKGKILYERYFGMANKESDVPWSRASTSQLASTTKTFTGAAVLYLHEHKYLSINDPVQSYLKDFPYPGITIKMLLNHRSGLPDYLHWVPKYRKDTRTPIYNDDILQLMARFKPALEFRPDTRFKYSNSNYALLACIIEEVTEMRYKDFMKRYVFEPLGMRNTFVFDPADGFPANATVSYKGNWTREPVMFADGVYGDKGIYSSVQDMYRWDQSFYHNKLLSNETMELAYGPCSFEKPGVKNYGLGWRMLCYPDGYKVIYHNGWWHGNNTCFYRFIKDNFTIIVLGNKYTGSIYRQPPVIYKIIQGENAANSDFGGED